MRKLYFLLLLLTTYTGFAFSPPVLIPPFDITVCQMEPFNLTIMYPQILAGGENPNLYSASYYTVLDDANAGTDAIINPEIFFVPGFQTVYIRVQEIANPSVFAVTSINLIASPLVNGVLTVSSDTICENDTNAFFTLEAFGGNPPYIFNYSIDGGVIMTVTTSVGNSVVVPLPALPLGTHAISLNGVTSSDFFCMNYVSQTQTINVVEAPTAAEPQDIIVEQVPYIGTAVFNITTNTPLLMNGDPNVTVSYYLTMVDAQAGINPITTPAAYFANNATIIWARVQNPSISCVALKNFGLYTTNPDIVFIPDAAFKNILVISDGANQVAEDLAYNFTSVDANHDGEIQYSEAANISMLNISQRGIADLTGLEAFHNLIRLNAGYNAPLTTIPTSALPLLADLSASHCNLTTLNLTNNHALKSLSCEYNSLTSLDFSQSPLMTFIHCQNNQLTTLNLTGLTALADLVASDNNITSVNTANLDSILTFNMALNELTSLDLTGMTTIQQLIIPGNHIDSINTAGCLNLTNLRCNTNQMTYLDVSESTLLTNLDCSENTIVDLDLSHNSVLCGLNCSWNQTMRFINIKNGVDSCYTNFNVFLGTNLQLLQFCCDDNEVNYFKNYFESLTALNLNVNSYCTFTPGGDYNTIDAGARFDGNNNGCDSGDAVYPNLRLNINDGTNSGAVFTDVTGVAHFFTQAGNFTITPAVENPTWFTISPASAAIPFANTDNNTATQNFCISANGSHPDLEVVFAPVIAARPGFNAMYKLAYKNKGNQTLSGSIALTYEDAVMDFTSSDVPPASQTTGVLNYNFTNIAPFESRSFYLYFHVNAPTNTPAVNIGDILDFQAVITSTGGDDNPADNTFAFHQTVVGSYDPNDIVCLEGNIVSPVEIGNYLHYIINFENTGNADAENIVVREVIDTTQFDISTLQLLNSSASVTTRITGNLAEFIFPSINLHSGGHGNILLKIRSNNSLTEGDMVSKRANIYFDYNFPVETLPENTVFQLLSNPGVDIDASVSIYPNPTKGLINIECSNTIKSVELYDVQGRILQTNLVNENQASLDVSTQSKGVYFIKIISDKGMKVQKIVKD